MKEEYSYRIYCFKKDLKELKINLINKFDQLKKKINQPKNDIIVEKKSKKFEYMESKKIPTKRLTQSGNWIPIITTFDGLLKTMKQNIEIIDKQDQKI